jgi:hypothetical protein
MVGHVLIVQLERKGHIVRMGSGHLPFWAKKGLKQCCLLFELFFSKSIQLCPLGRKEQPVFSFRC